MPTSSFHIKKLELSLHLGWSEKERSKERCVWLDVSLYFPVIPDACQTDNLSDTICYATLSDDIRKLTSAKSYKLIEHLSAEIYQFIKTKLKHNEILNVRITKFPAIGGLKDGVSFEYGDDLSSW